MGPVALDVEQDTNNIDNDEDNICELEHLRKLFVAGLSPATTEDSLRTFFGQWGKIVEVSLMRDPETNRSRRYGFVTYTKSKSVDTAQANRPHIIDGKTVESKRALPRPDQLIVEKKITVKKLFVGGLRDVHDEEALRQYFSQFGCVLSIKLPVDKNTGKNRRFGYIEYDDYDAVDKVILKKEHSIKNMVVDVKKSTYNLDNGHDNHSDSKIDKNKPGKKLFVGGLKDIHDEQSLLEYFTRFGNVVSIKMPTNKATGKNRHFAYIEYNDFNEVENALSQKEHYIKNVSVDVKKSTYNTDVEFGKRSQASEGNDNDPSRLKKVFVGGVKEGLDEKCLREYFKQFGNVVSVKLPTNKLTGKNRGFAYIEYDSCDAVERTLLKKEHILNYVSLDVKRSTYNIDKKDDDASLKSNGSNNLSKGINPVSGAPMYSNQMPQQAMMAPYSNQQPIAPMNGPVPNYNYYGPPGPMQPPYYQPNQMNGWNYGPQQNGWNPQQQPLQVPTAAMQQQTAHSQNASMQQQPGPMQQQQQQQPYQPDFGNGYQQNYNGGAIKQNNMNNNRMQPYATAIH